MVNILKYKEAFLIKHYEYLVNKSDLFNLIYRDIALNPSFFKESLLYFNQFDLNKNKELFKYTKEENLNFFKESFEKLMEEFVESNTDIAKFLSDTSKFFLSLKKNVNLYSKDPNAYLTISSDLTQWEEVGDLFVSNNRIPFNN